MARNIMWHPEPSGIERISVQGYKSLFEERSIEIRPLTVLAGANSSGKSSVLQPLLMLKQTLEAGYDPGALLINGPNVRFTEASQFFSRPSRAKQVNTFTITVATGRDRSVREVFGRDSRGAITIEEAEYQFGKDRPLVFRPRMSHDELVKQMKDQVERGPGAFSGRPVQLQVVRSKCFLAVEGRLGPGERMVRFVLPEYLFGPEILGVIHLPGLRGNPERTYVRTSVGPEFPGTFEKYAASIITHWKIIADDRLDELGQTLQALGLTWKVSPRAVDDTQVELRIGRLIHAARGGASDMVSIADAGFGVSQVLPVLVALLAASPNQLLYIEQPEIHLHPRAQHRLARVLASAANRGVRTVVETHSSLLLRGIQSTVAKGQLAPEKVKLYWFSRSDSDGATSVASADLDKSGRFGDWPEDFDEVTLDAEGQFLDAVEANATRDQK